jgi:threonyl-tRNA synthetase
MAEFGVLHRNEDSGALGGMTRVRRFVQDDAHIFCRVDQVEEEVKGVLDFIDYVYRIFGFTYELTLSTRPKDHIGDLETWAKAENDLEKALDDFGKPWVIKEGDGAFYGPKIDITVSDARNRKFQCATIQLDFQLPACFKLKYLSEKNEMEAPVMIHSAVLGSIERMFAILLEHYKGIWPFWLSPRQAIVCSLSEDCSSYAKQVQKQINEVGYYVDIDESDRSLRKKVAEARDAPYNYILVVGQKEVATGQVTVRLREDPEGRKDLPEMSIESLLDEFKFKTVNFL